MKLKYEQVFNPFGAYRCLSLPNCIARSNLLDAEKLLLGRLFQYAGENGECYPTRKSLCAELGWEMSKLKYTIKELKEHKLIKTIKPDPNAASRYYFLYHKVYDGMSIQEQEGHNGHGKPKQQFVRRSFRKKAEALAELTPAPRQRRLFKKPEPVSPPASTRQRLSNPDAKDSLGLRHRMGSGNDHKEKLARELNSLTVELIGYWNEQPTLKKHPLHKSPRTGKYHAESQLRYIQTADRNLDRLMRGSLYANCKDITEPQYRKMKVTMEMLKLAIRKFATETDASYGGVNGAERVSKMMLGDFFYSGHSEVLTKEKCKSYKYKYKYPFLHYFISVPQKVAEAQPFQKTTQYPTVVQAVIEMLKGHKGYVQNPKNFNKVVTLVNRAVENIKEAGANGSLNSIVQMLDKHLYDAMAGHRVHLDELYNAVEYKLVLNLRRRRFLA